MTEPYDYSEFNEFNRFENIDGIEWKIINHLIESKTVHAELLWKTLKYDDSSALNKPNLSEDDRRLLVCTDNGDQAQSKRLFMSPIVDDALQEQCSFVRIFVEDIFPANHMQATVGVTVEAITHNRISVVTGDGDPIINPKANPNDSDDQSSIVVVYKNRLTVMLKCLLAELNGLYLDGIGYLQLNDKTIAPNLKGSQGVLKYDSFAEGFYRYAIHFAVDMSGISDNADIGY